SPQRHHYSDGESYRSAHYAMLHWEPAASSCMMWRIVGLGAAFEQAERSLSVMSHEQGFPRWGFITHVAIGVQFNLSPVNRSASPPLSIGQVLIACLCPLPIVISPPRAVSAQSDDRPA